MDALLEELRLIEAKKLDSYINQLQFENNCDLKIKGIKNQIKEVGKQLALDILNRFASSTLTPEEIEIISQSLLQHFSESIHSNEEHRNKDLQNIVKTINDIKTRYPTWRLNSIFVIKINKNTYFNGYRYSFWADGFIFQYNKEF
jgi:hypothetical protein